MEEEENSLVAQVTKALHQHGGNILYGLAGLSLLMVILFRFAASGRNEAERDFIDAEAAYMEYRHQGNEEALTRLLEIQTRRPTLHAKYDGILCQILLARGLQDKAGHSCEQSLAIAEKLLPQPYVAFTKQNMGLLPLSSIEVESEKYPVLSSFLAMRTFIKESSGDDLSSLEGLHLDVRKHFETVSAGLEAYAKAR